jgi:cob(I)alamin adenosyltransferase
MSIVTKTGDRGETALFGGKRVQKDDLRIETYGTVDELNAVLGLVLAEPDLPHPARIQLTAIQHLLFRLGGDLATPHDVASKQERMSVDHVGELEMAVQELERSLPPQKAFLLPGGCRVSALLHLARTVCRRAERQAAALKRKEPLNENAFVFLNRLSDYLFLLARRMNIDMGGEDTEVQYG